jgi:hypothetical protein
VRLAATKAISAMNSAASSARATAIPLLRARQKSQAAPMSAKAQIRKMPLWKM